MRENFIKGKFYQLKKKQQKKNKNKKNKKLHDFITLKLMTIMQSVPSANKRVALCTRWAMFFNPFGPW